jgi:hypothetical protein
MDTECMDHDCPLCATSAKCRVAGQGDRKCFDCPRCGRFEIALRSEQVLSQSPRSWRQSYARRARQAPMGYMLAIGVPSSAQCAERNVAALSGDFVRC